MAKFKIFYTIIFLLFISVESINAQTVYYVRMQDATGIDLSSYQTELNTAATDLDLALPTAFQSAFKVYDYGFYLHNDKMDGGVDKIINDAEDIIKAQSTYYLLISRYIKPNDSNVYYSLKLHLPNSGNFACFKATNLEFEMDKINSKLKDVSTFSEVANAEEFIINSFKEVIVKIVNGCFCGRGESCDKDCLSSKEIYDLLIEKGFIGLPCKISEGNIIESDDNRIKNSSHCTIKNSNIVDKIKSLIIGLTNKDGSDIRIYLTDNKNFCNGGDFYKYNSEYNDNLIDMDFLIHLWKPDESEDGFIFVKNEYYLLVDDQKFYDDGDISLIGENETRNTSYYININPKDCKFYFSSKILPIPKNNVGGNFTEEYEYPYHTVELGETLNSISAKYGSFTVNEIATWNNLNPSDVVLVGDKLILFKDEVDINNSWEDFGVSLENNEELMIPLPLFTVFSKYFPVGAKFQFPDHLLPKIICYPKVFKRNEPQIILPITSPNIEELDVLNDIPIEHGSFKYLRILVNSSTIFALAMLISTNYVPEDKSEVHFQSKEYENDDLKPKRIYCTYTKEDKMPNPPNNTEIYSNTSKLYIGRTSGYLSPYLQVKKRDINHHRNPIYGDACLDYATLAIKGDSPEEKRTDPSYLFIRGREQRVIEDLGGAWCDNKGTLSESKLPFTRSGNKINGIDKKKKLGFYLSCMLLNPSVDKNYNGSEDCN